MDCSTAEITPLAYQRPAALRPLPRQSAAAWSLCRVGVGTSNGAGPLASSMILSRGSPSKSSYGNRRLCKPVFGCVEFGARKARTRSAVGNPTVDFLQVPSHQRAELAGRRHPASIAKSINMAGRAIALLGNGFHVAQLPAGRPFGHRGGGHNKSFRGLWRIARRYLRQPQRAIYGPQTGPYPKKSGCNRNSLKGRGLE